ncbi:hypothetical protein AAHA92_12939 [Salvia divinorum]|uniref:Uncharacterized protein n=1 Tax=Salvia divinorum TaxID=28513 RepID=A0ABD1H6P0_SALDI
MGSQAVQFFCEFKCPAYHNHFRRFIGDGGRTNYKACRWRFFTGGRRWNWEGNSRPNRRSRFSDAYSADEFDEEDVLEFRNAVKQRVWWSDDDDDDEEEEEKDGFGILEASIGFDWVFKILRAFGWMVPAVVISFFMGRGPDSIVMALALPLAQSAFYLAADTLWGRADETPKRKSKRKKRPFAGRSRARKEKGGQTRNRKEAGNYKSWFEGNNNYANESRNCQDFGGWDELDNPVRADKDPHVAPIKKEEEPGANA